MADVNVVANIADNQISSQTAGGYSATRDALSGTAGTVTDTLYYITNINNGGSTFTVTRIFFFFATGAVIPANATITAATLDFKTASDYTNTNGSSATLVAATPADATSIVGADFDQVGTTTFGAVALTAADTVHTITLNASGIAAIAIGSGNTVLALRASGDFANASPTGVELQVNIKSADAVADKPTLNVTYSTPDVQSGGYSFII